MLKIILNFVIEWIFLAFDAQETLPDASNALKLSCSLRPAQMFSKITLQLAKEAEAAD
jgi:hypothetical protein